MELWKQIASGIVLLVVGAVGGIYTYSFLFQGRISTLETKISEQESKNASSAQGSVNETPICTNYGIKIVSLRPSEAVGGQFKVSGIYTRKPAERVQLFFSFDGKDYWHHGIVQFDQSKKTWIGDLNITGAAGREAFIMVAIVGKSGRILHDYATKVGAETTQWPSLSELTDDIVECDRVQIITK